MTGPLPEGDKSQRMRTDVNAEYLRTKKVRTEGKKETSQAGLGESPVECRLDEKRDGQGVPDRCRADGLRVVYGTQVGRCDQGQAGRSRGTWPRPEGNHRLPWAAQQHSELYLEGKMLKYKT
jgi:hypothetical protein